MDKTLHDLGGIVLQGLPTFFLVLILAFFIKVLYLNPLDKVLEERFRLTEGARKAAEDSFRNADSKVAEYQEALNKARSEIYLEQAEFLRHLHAGQTAETQKVRAEAEQTLAAVRLSLSQEAAAAKESLGNRSEILANEIVEAILRGKAA